MKEKLIRHILMFILFIIYTVLYFTKSHFVEVIKAFCVGACIGLVSIKLAGWITKTK